MDSYKPNVLDITKAEFDVDAFLSWQLKEKSLDELIKEEEQMVTAVRRLDSDVHQLVYENYNKFLTATSTVRKIQEEFNQLDNEMDSLSSSMKKISGLIGDLSGVLGGKREDIAQLGSSYKVLSKLHFIFHLPSLMQTQLDENKFGDVVRIYLLARESLMKYEDIENVNGVMCKAESIIGETQQELRKRMFASTECMDSVSEAVELLLKLGNDEKEVSDLLLQAARTSLRKDLHTLEQDPADVLDLVDKGCASFLPNMTLFASLYQRHFSRRDDELLSMLQKEMDSLHSVVSKLFLSSTDPKDCSIVVRALDRYYRKITTCTQLVPGLDCSQTLISLIRDVSRHQIEISRKRIQEEMKIVLHQTREQLLSADADLVTLNSVTEHAFVHHVKTALANLLLFTASDVTFSSLPPSQFQAEFACDVHEHLLIASFKDLHDVAQSYGCSSSDARFANPIALLLLCISLHHLSSKSALYLINLCREQFGLTPQEFPKLTGSSDVTVLLKTAAQTLLRRYAEQRGLQIGENLVRGCSGGTQLSSSPTGVRAAIRRSVEEAVECESVLGILLGNNTRKEGRPRRTADAPRDSLWCERIDFHQQIHFNKASILTAVVKVMLKSFTECVRLQTYGKYAVEQIQVDCYYLQRGLAPLVADEVMVNSMVDQALSSALKRCLHPVLVHPSKLVQLCEYDEKTTQ